MHHSHNQKYSLVLQRVHPLTTEDTGNTAGSRPVFFGRQAFQDVLHWGEPDVCTLTPRGLRLCVPYPGKEFWYVLCAPVSFSGMCCALSRGGPVNDGSSSLTVRTKKARM